MPVPCARVRNDRCVVRAARAWLDTPGIHRSAVFRRVRRGDKPGAERLTDQCVALIVKRGARPAGLRPSFLSGYSLDQTLLPQPAKRAA